MNDADRRRDPPPVVLVHGWGGSYRTTWAGSRLEESLNRAGREIVAVHLPGHGPAGGSAEPEDYADIADQLADRLPGDGPVDAVGFSLGGKLLLHIAVISPDRLRRLAVGGVGDNLFASEEGEPLARALLERAPERCPSAVRAVVDEALASDNDPLALAATILRPPRLLCPAALSDVSAEIQLVLGADDQVALRHTKLAASLPRARIAVVPALGHVQTPRSAEFGRVVSTFLGRGPGHLQPTSVEAV